MFFTKWNYSLSQADKDQLKELKRKYALLDQERKNNFQQTQQQRQINKEQIAKYQKENKEMKNMIAAMKEQQEPAKRRAENGGGSANVRTEEDNDRDLQIWRRKLDDMKAKTVKKKEHLQIVKENFNELAKQQKELANQAVKT